jgi:arsenate reductase
MARTYNMLFLCTGNSARSIMAEAYLNSRGKHIRGFSAGSFPRGNIHPLALEWLRNLNIPTDALRSKSWNEFSVAGAPKMDFIVTVCDQAAGEVCPIWPGNPVTANWSIPDPAAATGTEAERRAAFGQAFSFLKRRIDLFLEFRFEHLDRIAIRRRLDQIGQEAKEPA